MSKTTTHTCDINGCENELTLDERGWKERLMGVLLLGPDRNNVEQRSYNTQPVDLCSEHSMAILKGGTIVSPYAEDGYEVIT